MGFFDKIPKWKMVLAEAYHLWGEEGISVKQVDGEIGIRIDVDRKIKIILAFDESNKGADVMALLPSYRGQNINIFQQEIRNILMQSEGFSIEFADGGRTPLIGWRYTGSSTNGHFSAQICVNGCAKFMTSFYEVIEPRAYC